MEIIRQQIWQKTATIIRIHENIQGGTDKNIWDTWALFSSAPVSYAAVCYLPGSIDSISTKWNYMHNNQETSAFRVLSK